MGKLLVFEFCHYVFVFCIYMFFSCVLMSAYHIFVILCAYVTVFHYRKNSKIWDTSNNCHNCPKIEKFDVALH